MKTMKNLCFALLAACVFFLPAAAQASEKTNVSILSVDGSGAGQTVPDQARISIGVTSHSSDAKQAQQENAERASAIQNALTTFGVTKVNPTGGRLTNNFLNRWFLARKVFLKLIELWCRHSRLPL